MNTSLYFLPFSIDNTFFFYSEGTIHKLCIQKRLWTVNNQIFRTTEELLTSYLEGSVGPNVKKDPHLSFMRSLQ